MNGSKTGVKIVSSATSDNHRKVRNFPTESRGDFLCHLIFTLLNKNGCATNYKNERRQMFWFARYNSFTVKPITHKKGLNSSEDSRKKIFNRKGKKKTVSNNFDDVSLYFPLSNESQIRRQY